MYTKLPFLHSIFIDYSPIILRFSEQNTFYFNSIRFSYIKYFNTTRITHFTHLSIIKYTTVFSFLPTVSIPTIFPIP